MVDQLLSVIIVSWNTRDLLKDCLSSLQRTSIARDSQLVVVDNASSDGTAAMVRTDFPSVELLASSCNLGFAAANNLALRRARGQYLLFLNPDTVVADGAIEAMMSYLEAHSDVGVVGTTLWNADGSLQYSCHRYYSFWHTIRHNRVVERLLNSREMATTNVAHTPQEVDWMTGACLLVPKSVLRSVGGFDPSFFVYGEETDLQFRIKKAGWRVVYVPSRGVVHYGGQSAKQAPMAASLHDYRGRWLFVRKHYSAFSAGSYLSKTVIGLIVWMVYWGIVSAGRSGVGAGQQLQAYRSLLAWHLFRRDLPPAPAPLVLVTGEE